MNELVTAIPQATRDRNPLIGEEGWLLLQSLVDHPDAPHWTRNVGDRIGADDLRAVDWFRRQLPGSRQWSAHGPTPTITRWATDMIASTAFHRSRIRDGVNPARSWVDLPAMDRHDLVTRMAEIVPDSAPLDELVVVRTAGITGEPLELPHHPRAIVADHPLLEATLAEHEITLETGPDVVAVANIGAEADPDIFAAVFAAWDDAAMVNVNLRPADWRTGIDGARRFFSDLEAQVITGEPAALLEARAWELDIRPAAVVTTGSALRTGTATRLREYFGCPVIDWYSLAEAGPVAGSAADGPGLRLLSGDLYVEIIDTHGRPGRPGTFGEIALTGGRNPYLPLVRYRTGDFGRLERVNGEPRLLDLRGRSPVLFRTGDGLPIHPREVGKALRNAALFVRHQVVQEEDGSVGAAIEPAEGMPVNWEALHRSLKGLFGDVRIAVESDTELGGAQPFRSEMSALDDADEPLSAPRDLDPGEVLVDSDIAGHTEDPLADDVPHDL
ncbi:MAG: hypothetical protein GY929_18355 [Actinomycetia bacterium]|nr:hypothetical protein [Actinomycetes bacterium]